MDVFTSMLGLKLILVSKMGPQNGANRVHNSWDVLYVVDYIHYYGEWQ